MNNRLNIFFRKHENVNFNDSKLKIFILMRKPRKRNSMHFKPQSIYFVVIMIYTTYFYELWNTIKYVNVQEFSQYSLVHDKKKKINNQ